MKRNFTQRAIEAAARKLDREAVESSRRAAQVCTEREMRRILGSVRDDKPSDRPTEDEEQRGAERRREALERQLRGGAVEEMGDVTAEQAGRLMSKSEVIMHRFSLDGAPWREIEIPTVRREITPLDPGVAREGAVTPFSPEPERFRLADDDGRSYQVEATGEWADAMRTDEGRRRVLEMIREREAADAAEDRFPGLPSGCEGAEPVLANTSPHEGAEVTIESVEQAFQDLRDLMGECRVHWCSDIAALHAHGLCMGHYQAEVAARRCEGNQPSATDKAPGVTPRVVIRCEGDWE